MMTASVKEEMYYHPERFPSIWWHVTPIWTELARTVRADVAQWCPKLFVNYGDLMLREQVR